MKPGSRLRAWASHICSPDVMARLIDAVIADLQWEHEDAVRRCRRWQPYLALLRGYVAFWKVFARCAAAKVSRPLHEDDGALGRSVGYALMTSIVLTALFTAPPLLGLPLRDALTPWTLIMLLPQAVPLSMPVGLLFGVLCGLHGRPTTTQVRRGILGIGLVGSLVMMVTIGWVVPAANQAFRVAVAGHDIARGAAELEPVALRAEAYAWKARSERWPDQAELARAGELMLRYHARWALSGAALVLALLGLGITELRLSRAATIAAGITAPVAYLAYIFELGDIQGALFSNEPTAVALAWLPNLLLTVIAVACLQRGEAEATGQKTSS